jgi:two-component sensor histidine kinase
LSDPERPPVASVLYIDDDPALRRLVERTLSRQGYRIVPVASGDEGLTRLGHDHFDAIALDHFMPGKEGLEVLAAIRALPDPPPVIYASGSDEGRIAIAALKAGAADYVIKDVGGVFLELLQNAIDTAVEQDRMRRRKDVIEREMREARERAETLLREVNHRVANSLALVASFVFLQQKAIGADQTLARNALADVQARISAIAQIHRRLYTSEDVSTIEMDAYLSGLIEELAAAMTSSGIARAIKLSAEPIQMATDRAVSLGVIVTELVTNACKYAYPSGEPGEIRVRLERGTGVARLIVEDDGVGIVDGATVKGTGLGTRIVRAMAASLQATWDTDPAHKGTRVVLTIPDATPGDGS